MKQFVNVKKILKEINNDANSRFHLTDKFIQHGKTSVMKHCISVAHTSDAIADKLHIKCDKRALIRGALLHDYFLYDWHELDKSHSLHGFKHPFFALNNASRDFRLSNIEKNIIVRHMFPLVPVPPTCREAWIVCLADKYCSTKETMYTVKKKMATMRKKVLKRK